MQIESESQHTNSDQTISEQNETVMVMILAIVFIICYFPSLISNIFSPIIGMDSFIYDFAYLLSYICVAGKFFVYICCGKHYLKTFNDMFSCW